MSVCVNEWRWRERKDHTRARGICPAAGKGAPCHTHMHSGCAPTTSSSWAGARTGTGTGASEGMMRGMHHNGRLRWRLRLLGWVVIRRGEWPHVLADEHCGNLEVSICSNVEM